MAGTESTQSPLQREIRQSRPFRSVADEAVVGLLRTTDAVRRFLARVVEPHGITLQQYNVLRILRGAGEAGLPTLEIGTRMIEEAPGVTRLIDRLEAKRLVSRERCPVDRRQVLCRATPGGVALTNALDEPTARAAEEAVAGLSPELRRALVELLDAVRAGHPTSKELLNENQREDSP